MAVSQVFQKMFDYSDGVVAKYVTDVAASTAGTIQGMAYTLLLIYMMLWGWSVMRGIIQEPVMDGGWRILKIAIIFHLATSSALYSQYVSDLLYNWPTEFASQLQGSPATTSAQMLDQMLDKGTTLAGEAWEKANIGNIGAYILAGVVYVLTWVTTGITGIIIIMAKLALAITLAIGPLFILFLLFDPTKRWFDSWLGAVFTEGIAILLTVMAATISFKLMNAAYDVTIADATANDGIATMSAISGLVIYGIASIFVIQRMPVLAGSIGGSLSSGSASPLGWAYDKIRGATPAALRAGKRVGQGGYRRLRDATGRFGRGSEGGGITGNKGSPPGAVYRKITSASSRRARAA